MPVPGLRLRVIVLTEGMCRVNTDNAQLTGKKAQLFHGDFDQWLFRMAFNIHVKLRCLKCAADLVAFKLGEVDAAGGKAAERFMPPSDL